MYEEIDKLSVTVAARLEKKNLKGRTLTLKVKYADFTQITRSRSFTDAIEGRLQIAEQAKQLLDTTEPAGKPVRLLGVTVSSFSGIVLPGKDSDNSQLSLF